MRGSSEWCALLHPHPNPPPSRGRGKDGAPHRFPLPPCGGGSGRGVCRRHPSSRRLVLHADRAQGMVGMGIGMVMMAVVVVVTVTVVMGMIMMVMIGPVAVMVMVMPGLAGADALHVVVVALLREADLGLVEIGRAHV